MKGNMITRQRVTPQWGKGFGDGLSWDSFQTWLLGRDKPMNTLQGSATFVLRHILYSFKPTTEFKSTYIYKK